MGQVGDAAQRPVGPKFPDDLFEPQVADDVAERLVAGCEDLVELADRNPDVVGVLVRTLSPAATFGWHRNPPDCQASCPDPL